MIGITGFFGAGKSLATTRMLKRDFDRGNFIITNFDCVFAHKKIIGIAGFIQIMLEILALKEQEKKISDLFPDWHGGEKITIVLDEAGVLFGARNWQQWKNHENILPALLQVRKIGVEIYYIVQYPSLVDKNFRTVTEFWIYFRKFGILPFGSKRELILNPENPTISTAEPITKSLYWAGSQKAYFWYDTHELIYSSEDESFTRPFGSLLDAKIFSKAPKYLPQKQAEFEKTISFKISKKFKKWKIKISELCKSSLEKFGFRAKNKPAERAVFARKKIIQDEKLKQGTPK